MNYANALEQRREDHFRKDEKYRRYLLLRRRLLAEIAADRLPRGESTDE